MHVCENEGAQIREYSCVSIYVYVLWEGVGIYVFCECRVEKRS